VARTPSLFGTDVLVEALLICMSVILAPHSHARLDGHCLGLEQRLALIIPVHNEIEALPRLLRHLGSLHPAPDEVIVVDGCSDDGTLEYAREAGLRVVCCEKGRPNQINRGVAEATSPLICVLHADTLLPDDGVTTIRSVLGDNSVALAGFISVMSGPDKVRWVTTFHNYIKTWYAPALFRPVLFITRGLRLLFGDHAMFFRRADFLNVGGLDCGIPVMEEGDLCLKMCRLGRMKLVNRIVISSDRRVAEWGEFKANLIYMKVAILWGLGVRGEALSRHYPDIP
jgi:glycosyltransferase involved in cell wall biosynthesis